MYWGSIIKRIIGLALVCFLVLSCEPVDQSPKTELAELIVKNQSSVRISKIKYNGLYFHYDQSDTFKAEVLDSGKKATAEFGEEQAGYMFFTLLDEKDDAILEVRTNEILTVPKGERIVFIITDNTLVVGATEGTPSTLINLTMPAVLRIENGTSNELYDVQYNGKNFFTSYNGSGYCLERGRSVTKRFYNVNSYSGYVLFRARGDMSLKEIKEEIKIEKGMMTILTIKNDSYTVKTEKI